MIQSEPDITEIKTGVKIYSMFDTHKRNKSENTPEFNKKAKARRIKAKHDAKNRKRNQKRS